MSLLTFFQFLETLAAYMVVTLALPCVFLHKELSQYRFANRILLYFIIGNFYATNLVFLLQLLHISNFFTLWIGLLAVPAVIRERMNHFSSVERLRLFAHQGRKLLTGSLGIKSTIDSVWRKVRRYCIRGLERFADHWLDWVLVTALFLMVMWSFGIRMVQVFGYGASDIPVHLSWVNALKENKIYVDGVYPFGMHAVIYLINELFGIDIYAIFRVFPVVQCLAINMAALLVLKLCCKSRFAAYAGVFLYAVTKYFAGGIFWRFHSALPQEYSMVYILPTAYYAFYFFQEKRRELKEFEESEKAEKTGELEGSEEFEGSGEIEEGSRGLESSGGIEEVSGEFEGSSETEEADEPEEADGLEGSKKRKKLWRIKRRKIKESKESRELKGSKGSKESRSIKKAKKKIPEKSSRVALAGLIMSFSLCVTAHFYGAIVAALFCIGIAVGYAGWLIRPVYLTRIVASGFISLAIAVLPMGIAFAMGAPLEGSLNWATGVITDNVQKNEEQASGSTAPEPSAQPSEPSAQAPGPSAQAPAPSVQPRGAQNAGAGTAGPPAAVQSRPPMTKRVLSAIQSRLLRPIQRLSVRLWDVIGNKTMFNLFRDTGQDAEWCSLALRVMIIFLTAAGAVLLLTPARVYGAMLFSTGVFTIMMSLMFAGLEVGITPLMDETRSVIFYAYEIVVVISFTLDVCIWAATTLLQGQWCRDVASFAAVVALGVFLWQHDMIRSPQTADGLESNEAVTCLANIIATEPDYTWTIFSANDETQMVYEHGYHYELSVFLRQIEIVRDFTITVPTETAYFFIEKIPVAFWFSEQTPVSREGAEHVVPHDTGLGAYKGRDRWIVMSHMYYWAQEFQRLYPNEMKIYMETDSFICYRLEQNTYSLYDLAIDYGYNYVMSEEQ